MRAVVLGLALVLLAGCQGRLFSPFAALPGAEHTFDAPEPLVEALAERRGRLGDVKARARVTLQTPDQEISTSYAVVLKGFRYLRLETLSPIGQPTGIFVARGDYIRWVDPMGGRYWAGPASREVLERLIGVPLVPEEMVAILSGALPPGADAAGSRLEPDPQEEAYRLTLPVGGLTEELVVARGDLSVRSRTRHDAGGQEVLRVVYGRFRNLEEYPFPLSVEVALPPMEYALKVDYQKVLVNQKVDEGLFDLAIPPGFKMVNLE